MSRGPQSPNRVLLRRASVRVLRGEPRVRSHVRDIAERRGSTLRCAASRGTDTSTHSSGNRRSVSTGGGRRARYKSRASGSTSMVRSSTACVTSRETHTSTHPMGITFGFAGDWGRARYKSRGYDSTSVSRWVASRGRDRRAIGGRASAAKRATCVRVDSTPTSPSLDGLREGALRARDVATSLRLRGTARWRRSTAPARLATDAARALESPRVRRDSAARVCESHESRLQLLNCGQEGADSCIDGRRVRGVGVRGGAIERAVRGRRGQGR